MNDWYLVYTKPKAEDMLEKKFTGAGFEVLNPKLLERKYIKGKVQAVASPLFPSYIFVKFDYLKDYRLVKYTRGVRKIVGSSNLPYIVEEQIIDAIRNRIENGVVPLRTSQFQRGEGVKIKAGPFQGIEALFEHDLKGGERVMVLLNAINARVVVDRAILKKAE